MHVFSFVSLVLLHVSFLNLEQVFYKTLHLFVYYLNFIYLINFSFTYLFLFFIFYFLKKKRSINSKEKGKEKKKKKNYKISFRIASISEALPTLSEAFLKAKTLAFD